MPLYRYECPEGHVTEEYRRLKDWVESVECSNHDCKYTASICFPTRIGVQTFNPYVEENINGTPIPITSKKQRDELLKKHGLTYDSNKHHRKPKYTPAVENVDFAEVKRISEQTTEEEDRVNRESRQQELLDVDIPTRFIKR
jgi:hypothetical protein